MVYLDNAATSYIKPRLVSEAVFHFLQSCSANPGRAGHQLANRNAMLLYETRDLLARFFNAPDPLSVVFTSGVTSSLNMLLKGLLKPGDEVLVSPLEHNAIMRPLRSLEKKGIVVSVADADEGGVLSVDGLERACSEKTKLIAVNHISNVTGVIQPVKAIGEWCRKKGFLFLLDTAQSAGSVPIDMQEESIDIVAFTGHKGLMGPMGIGGFVLGERIDPLMITPLIEGGTGSNSETEVQPAFMPDRFESGTPNLPGVVGLHAALTYIEEEGVDTLRRQELLLVEYLVAGLRAIDAVSVLGHIEPGRYGPLVSFTVRGKDLGEFATALDVEFGVCCRAGLHCAPAAHRYLNTFPSGTIRFSVSSFTTEAEIERAVIAVKELSI